MWLSSHFSELQDFYQTIWVKRGIFSWDRTRTELGSSISRIFKLAVRSIFLGGGTGVVDGEGEQ